MNANMVASAGQVGAQLPREYIVTRRLGLSESASVSIARHCAPLFLCAAAACFIVQRSGSSGFGHFRCGAEFRSHTRRLLCRCAKMAAIVRPLPFLPGGSARQARGSRSERMSWFIASLIAYVERRDARMSPDSVDSALDLVLDSVSEDEPRMESPRQRVTRRVLRVQRDRHLGSGSVSGNRVCQDLSQPLPIPGYKLVELSAKLRSNGE